VPATNSSSAAATKPTNQNCLLSLEDYLVWTVEAQLPRDFARLVFELCHVVLGLRPATRRDEADIVRGWLEREEAAGFWPGQVGF
jgi:ubiquitin carboxyl-terminal hydrolase 6/32